MGRGQFKLPKALHKFVNNLVLVMHGYSFILSCLVQRKRKYTTTSHFSPSQLLINILFDVGYAIQSKLFYLNILFYVENIIPGGSYKFFMGQLFTTRLEHLVMNSLGCFFQNRVVLKTLKGEGIAILDKLESCYQTRNSDKIQGVLKFTKSKFRGVLKTRQGGAIPDKNRDSDKFRQNTGGC